MSKEREASGKRKVRSLLIDLKQMYRIDETSHRRDTEDAKNAQREAYPLRPLCVLCVSAVNLIESAYSS